VRYHLTLEFRARAVPKTLVFDTGENLYSRINPDT
jgi:hypothetical protein